MGKLSVISDRELAERSIDFSVDFRRDPEGLMRAVGEEMNRILQHHDFMRRWTFAMEYQNLPGAISVVVSGTANHGSREAFDCPAFFAATSVATADEVREAAGRLAARAIRFITEAERVPA